MREYTKPLVDVYELRVNENIAVSASAQAKWEKYGTGDAGVWVTETDLALGGGSRG